MKKIFLALTLVVLGLFTPALINKVTAATVWTTGVTPDMSAPFSGGDGSAANPYLISSVTDLVQLAANVNSSPANTYVGKYFLLTTDLDLAGKTWEPIGYEYSISNAFRGNFNGGYHLINNMNINQTDLSAAGRFLGFFGWVYGGAQITNLGLTNAQISVTETRPNLHDVGLLLGYADDGVTVENCFAQGNIRATVNVRSIGGLIGQTYSGSTINNTYFVGSINSLGGDRAAGLVAYHRSSVPLSNSYVVAEITSSASNQYTITDGISANSYYNSDVTTVTSGIGAAKTTAEMKTAGMATALGIAWQYDGNKNSGYPYLNGFNLITPTPKSTSPTSSSNHSSSHSDPQPATAPVCSNIKPVSQPDLFQIDITGDSAKMYFSPVQGYTNEYLVTFSENPDAMTHSANVQLAPEGVQSYDLYYLLPNKTYYLKVAAKNGCAIGEWSNTMQFKTAGAKTSQSFYRY